MHRLYARSTWIPAALAWALAAAPLSAEAADASAPKAPAPTAAPASEAGWVPLWNGKDWTGLDGSLTDGSDWKKIFTIDKGTIHVVAPFVYGFITTTKAYSHYRARVEYRFADNVPKGANSGFLYQASGAMLPGNQWPASLEFQLRKGEAGTLWIFGGPFVSATQKDGVFANVEDGGTWKEIGGTGYQRIKGRSFPETDGWNRAELLVWGDNSVHTLNGVVTFKGNAIRILDSTGKKVPLDKGAIRLQSEGAEIFFRNFAIQELDPTTGMPRAAAPAR